MDWSGSFIFLLLVVIVFTTAVFYSLYKLQKEQTKHIEQLRLSGEKKYLDLADLLPQIVFECDFEGQISFINANGLKTTGLTRIDIQNGLNISKLIIEQERNKFWEEFLYIREGGLNRGQEFYVVLKNHKTNRAPMMFYMSQVFAEEKKRSGSRNYCGYF